MSAAVQTQGMTPFIQVFDMQASLAFYCGILAFELMDKAVPKIISVGCC